LTARGAPSYLSAMKRVRPATALGGARAACLALAALLGAAGIPSARAADPAEQARRAGVVAHIGPRVVTVGELEDRLAAVPRFQLVTFGATPDAIRRKFLGDVLVPEVLLAIGAEERHLDHELPTEMHLERALSNATLRAQRAQIGPAASIAMDDVKRFFEENRARYDSPERINVWRVLCRTRDEAAAVLDTVRKDPTVTAWNTLARDHSLDKATFMRGGNLGFLGPDGASNEAGLRVEPVVVKAAATVHDGDFVPVPIPEGEYFAVVWRRGTVGASHRTVEQVAAQIRDTLWKQRTEAAEKKLIDDLRARDLHEVNEALLNGIEITATDGAIAPRRRPGQVAPLPGSGPRSQPIPTIPR
jgi:peptidyl-prolyl cis-trans isomerase C